MNPTLLIMLGLVVMPAGFTIDSLEAQASMTAPEQRSDHTPRSRAQDQDSVRISLDLVSVTFGDALKVIAKAGKVRLVYSKHLVPLERHVSLRVTEKPVLEVLRMLLKDTGVEPQVAKTGQIILQRSRWSDTSSHSSAVSRQTGTVLGRVTDAKTGLGVAGAEVFLEDMRWRTAADTGGRYRLGEVEAGSYTLTVRRLGYAKQHLPVTVVDGRTDTVDVALRALAVPLDELVSTVTGPQRRRDIGYPVTTINADSVLRNSAARSVTDLLQNRVPGLTVQHTSGAPGDPAKLRFHGLNSLLRSNDPVIIVDGVRIYSAQSDARSGNLTNLSPISIVPNASGALTPLPAPSPLDQIDPNTIEKIETFSGPAASTLYGPDAANGVIVITTKRGRPGPTQWQVEYKHARTTPPGQFPTGYYSFGHLLDGGDHFCTVQAVRAFMCTQDSVVAFQLLNIPALTVLDVGHVNDLSLSASGGNQALTFALTGRYSNEIGPLKMPTYELDRFATTFNRPAPDWMQRPHHYTTWSVESKIRARLGATADVSLLSTVARSEQQRSSLEQQLPSLMATYADTVNHIYYRALDLFSASYINTVGLPNATEQILRNYYLRTTASALTFNTGLQAEWRPRAWFSGNAQANVNVVSRNDGALLPDGLVDVGYLSHATGRTVLGSFRLFGQVQKQLGHGLIFTTTGGTDLTTTTIADVVASAAGLVPGTSSLANAKRFASLDQAASTSVFGWFLEPNLAGRRFGISTGFRLDGGSAYGAKLTRTGGFLGGLFGGLLALPKLNGTWMISEEPWFPLRGIFSSLRLRGGYGQAQVQPGVTDRLRLYAQDSLGEGPAGSLGIRNLGNTALRPERSTEINGGFDADVLDSRVSVQLNLYRKRQVDALMPAALPPSVNGGGTILFNLGNIRNTGFDMTFDLTPVRSAALTWHAQLLYNRNTDLLEKLGAGVVPNKANGWVAGYPVGSRWTRPILGYADQNGDGVLQTTEIQLGDSLVYMGRLYPAYTMAWSTDVVLFGGAISVAAGFSYQYGATQINQTARTNWVLEPAFSDPNTPLAQQAAVFATVPPGDPGIVNGNQTDYGLIQDVSTLRFQSLSVGYRAPTPVAHLLKAQELSVRLQGSNLGLHSTYKGKDPDVSAWSPGENVVDTGQLPLPRLWQLAVSLRY